MGWQHSWQYSREWLVSSLMMGKAHWVRNMVEYCLEVAARGVMDKVLLVRERVQCVTDW